MLLLAPYGRSAATSAVIRSIDLLVVYQLPVQLRVLCVWPMKCRAETDYPRVSRFPVPQDKGNVGSGDEIVQVMKNEK